MPDHRAFRPVILIFSFFVFLQLGTGALLYAWKIGFHPASTFEYYRGSEAMKSVYPDRPDRFIQPRTFSGLVKSAVGHSIAYGLMCFLLTHLLRSLAFQTPGARWTDALSFLFFLTAFFDLIGGFFVLYGPPFTAWIRTAFFLAFECTGLWITIRLLTFLRDPEGLPAR